MIKEFKFLRPYRKAMEDYEKFIGCGYGEWIHEV